MPFTGLEVVFILVETEFAFLTSSQSLEVVFILTFKTFCEYMYSAVTDDPLQWGVPTHERRLDSFPESHLERLLLVLF